MAKVNNQSIFNDTESAFILIFNRIRILSVSLSEATLRKVANNIDSECEDGPSNWLSQDLFTAKTSNLL
jgi:hypothetical protein